MRGSVWAIALFFAQAVGGLGGGVGLQGATKAWGLDGAAGASSSGSAAIRVVVPTFASTLSPKIGSEGNNVTGWCLRSNAPDLAFEVFISGGNSEGGVVSRYPILPAPLWARECDSKRGASLLTSALLKNIHPAEAVRLVAVVRP